MFLKVTANCHFGISAEKALFTNATSTTMPVEPGIVDTNVLVCTLNADATKNASSRALLEAGRAASVSLYVTSQIICEFYSVVTNPRRVANQRSPAAAPAAISSLLGFSARVARAGTHC